MSSLSLFLRRGILSIIILLKESETLPSLNQLNCSSESRCHCALDNKTELLHLTSDCSSLNLTTIPLFEENVTEIILSHNNFASIVSTQKLPGDLLSLDISYCNVQSIERGFVRQFPNLKYLDISYNRELTLDVLSNITFDLQFTSIEIFKFEAIQCLFGAGTTLKLHYMYPLRNTSLKEINFASNRIEILEQFIILNLPNSLETLTAACNQFRFGWYLLELSYLPNIRYVNLSHQYSSDAKFDHWFFRTPCNDSKAKLETHVKGKWTYFPSSYRTPFKDMRSCLEEYHEKFKNLKFRIFICFPRSVETLILDHSIVSLYRKTFNDYMIYDLRSIKFINLNKNYVESLYNMVWSANLSKADYTENVAFFISPSFFHGARLKYLSLANNRLGEEMTEDQWIPIFRGQKYLESLSLEKNTIRRTAFSIFDPMINLKELRLGQNQLEKITFNIGNLKQLKYLDLSGNLFKSLTKSEMQVLDSLHQSHLEINLGKNELLYSCETLEFLKWMQVNMDSKRITFTNFNEYACLQTNSTGVKFSNLRELIKRFDKECASYTGIIVVSSISVITAIVVVIIGILHRFRWRLRYLYYMAKRTYKGNTRRGYVNAISLQRLYIYDAFISYSNDDRDFALHEMKHEIEDKTGMKLCFHQRDFLPGYDIAENIVNAIRDSRKVVCVVSESFLTSHWCMYEFNMALMERHHGRDGEDLLLLALLENINFEKAPLTMLEFIRNNSYVEYPDDESCKPLFWSKITEAISV